MSCLFCDIVEKKIPADIVLETDELMAFNDISPQAPVHILIIPQKHIATINDIDAGDAELIGKIILAAKQLAAEKGLSENGYRLVFNCNKDGGQAVYHIHCHLLGGRSLQWPPG